MSGEQNIADAVVAEAAATIDNADLVDTWVEMDEEVLPIEVRVVQSVEERMKDEPFFTAYNDQDLLTMIHDLLTRAKVPSDIIHGKALSYYHMIKAYHKKRQTKFVLRDNILLHVSGARKDYSNTADVVGSMNIKKPFAAKENDLNELYIPLPARIGDPQTWTPKQDMDVAIGNTDYVRVVERDDQPLNVIGYFKRPIDPSHNPVVHVSLAERMSDHLGRPRTWNRSKLTYKSLELSQPFDKSFEEYMSAVHNRFDVNGFSKELTELTDLESLAKMLYAYDGVEIDELTTVQQKVIFFRLMRLADLE
jgi:hypothetical protein